MISYVCWLHAWNWVHFTVTSRRVFKVNDLWLVFDVIQTCTCRLIAGRRGERSQRSHNSLFNQPNWDEFAETHSGWQQRCKYVTDAHVHTHSYKPRHSLAVHCFGVLSLLHVPGLVLITLWSVMSTTIMVFGEEYSRILTVICPWITGTDRSYLVRHLEIDNGYAFYVTASTQRGPSVNAKAAIQVLESRKGKKL